MTITSAVIAILIGIVVGVVGRLLIPGDQTVGMLLTILVGIDSAFIGTLIAHALGIFTATSGVDWLELLGQVIVAVVGVALVSALTERTGGGLVGGTPASPAEDFARRARLTASAGLAPVHGRSSIKVHGAAQL
jgi:uncharacterized membrane protein YeaQ/YmgE (transglycosylase-associated protein family)